ncbi:stage II sporulation protein P [Paenibacillus sp. Soil787]|uniref:stage II sporulation protein P n=1 Tax=Paenibacillus sp. Soil787 TaxID=1736411 RepID=UPI000702E436|nr:stage II sporulation protein P [Paenibacillus sp. Soil787]KRF22531.1 hypothetical protein ASG93_29900 [Paenibacillus sp. Soil787]
MSDQTEKILRMIKNSPEIYPSADFIHATKRDLIERALKLRKRQKTIRSFYAGFLSLAVLITVLWITSFGGKEGILNSVDAGYRLFSSLAVDKPEVQKPLLQNPEVFIYHSHYEESFLPDMLKTPGTVIPPNQQAYSKDINITLVGKHLAVKLNELGVRTLADNTDYEEEEKQKFEFSRSYDYSKETVSKNLQQYPGIHMIFDIHRDSVHREQSTVKWNNLDVASIKFIAIPSENITFAKKINNKFEELYPGVSEGVVTSTETKNTYNQEMHPHSILIEIGGQENSLEEVYRTTDMLAGIIKDLLKQE